MKYKKSMTIFGTILALGIAVPSIIVATNNNNNNNDKNSAMVKILDTTIPSKGLNPAMVKIENTAKQTAPWHYIEWLAPTKIVDLAMTKVEDNAYAVVKDTAGFTQLGLEAANATQMWVSTNAGENVKEIKTIEIRDYKSNTYIIDPGGNLHRNVDIWKAEVAILRVGQPVEYVKCTMMWETGTHQLASGFYGWLN